MKEKFKTWPTLSSWWQSIDPRLVMLMTSGFYYLLLTRVYEFKPYILVVLAFGLSVFYLLRLSVVETLMSLLVFVLPFQKGLRGWEIMVVQPGFESWQVGYSYYFGLTLKLIFIIALIFIWWKEKNDSSRKLLKTDWWWLLFILISTLTTLVFHSSFLHAFLGWIAIMASSAFYFFGRIIKKKFLPLVLSLLLGQTVFLSTIGLWQYVHQSSLGLFLEEAVSVSSVGYYTTEDFGIYRVSGLMGHPTFFASYLIMLFFVSLGIYLKKEKENRHYKMASFLAVALSFFSIFATFSRSAVLALMLGLGAWRWLSPQTLSQAKIILQFKKNNWVKAGIIGFIAFLLISFYPLFTLRLEGWEDWSRFGNISGRWTLIEHAITMVKSRPWGGVGVNMFTFELAKLSNNPTDRAFLFPVHNTNLLFFAELGILGGLGFLMFQISWLRSNWFKHKKAMSVAVLVAVITFMINSQFHTLFSQDPSFEMMMLLSGLIFIL